MATAEKVISCKLCSNIFKQYYLPENTFARQAMDEVLESLLEGSPRDEAIFRVRLLSAYKGEQQKHLTNVVADTISEVVAILGPLLAPDSRDGFQSEFRRLLQEAVKLWGPLQRSAMRARVDDNVEKDWDWEKYKDYDTAKGPNADQAAHGLSYPLEPLFPRVSIGDDVICPGYALWSGQNVLVAAGIEYSQLKSSNPSHTRTGSSRGGLARQGTGSDRRRQGSSGSASAGGRPGDSPTSPRTQSFADHASSRNMTSP
jgi:hypothetical protein